MSASPINWLRRVTARRIVPPTVATTPPDHGPTRVLLECAPENSPSIVESVLERAGYDVSVCEGPGDHHRCPLTSGRACEAVRAADVVVNMLGDGTPDRREVLNAVLNSGPARPPVVALVNDRDEPAPGVHAIHRRVVADELVDAIDAAVLDAHGRVPGGAAGR